jgi:hypothetical protein
MRRQRRDAGTRWPGATRFFSALLLCGIPDFSDDIRFAEAGDADRRRKADIKSSCDAATWHQRDDHRNGGYQSSS